VPSGGGGGSSDPADVGVRNASSASYSRSSRRGGPDRAERGSGSGGSGSSGGSGAHHHAPSRQPSLDPTLLARGMSARSVGARVSGRVRPVAPTDVEKDLRHMEAYGAACTAYAQQFFAYVNRDLVSKGHYGPVPLGPGLAGAAAAGGASASPGGTAMTNGAATGLDGKLGKGGAHYDAVTGRYVTPQASQSSAQKHRHHVPPVSMPVRIDPEEEKRLALLRKRVAASEAKREVLETEYLSLRAHYWYENQKLRRTRRLAKGQAELLRELAKRRGRVIALRRVRCAIARDVLKCLEYRAKVPGAGGGKANANGPQAMEGVEPTDGQRNGKSPAADAVPRSKDLLELWNAIEAQLVEAERACVLIGTPPDLLAAKELMGQASAMGGGGSESSSPPKTESSSSSGSKRSKSPVRGGKDKEKDKARGAEGGDKGDSKENGKTKSSSSDKSSKKEKEKGKGGSEDGAKEKESAKKGKKDSSASAIEEDEDDDINTLPWDSQFVPATPMGVPVLLSYLSSAPDRGAAYGTGNIMGSSPHHLSWIESNLPKTFDHPEYLAPYAEGHEELLRLREEVQYLEEELDLEKGNNRELQRQIIAGRKKSDGVCSIMGMLRTETDAVLNRHNAILDTPEARDLAAELHQRALQEAAEEDEEDDEEVDEDELDEDDSGEGAFAASGVRRRTKEGGGEDDADDELSAYEPEGGEGGATPVDDIEEESDFDGQEVRVKEVIVPISGAAGRHSTAAGGAEGVGTSDEEGEINEEEGEINEEDDGEINGGSGSADVGVLKRGVMEGVGIENTSKRRKL